MENHARSEIEKIIDEWIHSEMDRKILRRKLLDGITHERLAEELDVSVSCIKQRVKRGKTILYKHL